MPQKPSISFLAELLAATTLSYVVSQALKAFMKDQSFLETFDTPAFTDFILFNIVKIPIQSAWNSLLDDLLDTKPAHVKPKAEDEKKPADIAKNAKPKSLWKVVLIKLILNQTFYSVFINGATIAFMSYRRRSRAGTMTYEAVYGDLARRFWPLYADALKIWPIINAIAFAFFDTQPRMRFITAANLIWSVYLILMVT